MRQVEWQWPGGRPIAVMQHKARHIEGNALGPDGSRFRVNEAMFELPVPGAHNVVNALAAIATAFVLGVPLEAMVTPLASFAGIGRRFGRF